MINITRIREKHKVVLMAEYLQLHGLAPSVESSNGDWLMDEYTAGENIFTKAKTTGFLVHNHWYDFNSNHQVCKCRKGL